jgi:hypothetical protein
MKLLVLLTQWFFTGGGKPHLSTEMSWFQKICRNAGLMIHHAVKPLKKSDRKELKRTVEEKKVSPTTTLRRTTIEEIEVRQEDKDKD